MSYFVFGIMNFTKQLEEEGENNLAFQVAERASATRLHVQLGYNIWHTEVWEVLGVEPRAVRGVGLPFLLTDSPILDTSEELVSPWYVDVAGWGEWSPFRGSLERIGKFFLSLSKVSEIKDLVVYFGQGVDTSYEDIQVKVEQFTEVAFAFFRKAEDIASSRFTISW